MAQEAADPNTRFASCMLRVCGMVFQDSRLCGAWSIIRRGEQGKLHQRSWAQMADRVSRDSALRLVCAFNNINTGEYDMG